MTLLVTWRADDPATETFRSEDRAAIAAKLEALGVAYELWSTDRELADDAGETDVLEAYADRIEPLREAGYTTLDVMRMKNTGQPDFAEKAAAGRAKFLDEHTHADDEVRYFVEGSGTFYLHVGEEVYAILCEAGDLLNVPAGTTHWFDLGEADPMFCAIRFFRITDGWVGDFTGADISGNFPTHDQLQASRVAA